MDAARRIADQCLLMRSRRLSRVVTRLYLERMRAVDLTVAQLSLLAAIGAHPGARAADLVVGLDIEKSTLSRELASLTEQGLVVVEALGGRSQGLRLSPSGAQRLEDAYPVWAAAQEEIRRELGVLGEALLSHFPGR